jgi:hypothetical protein
MGFSSSPLLETIKKMKGTIPKSWEKALAEHLDEIVSLMRELFVGRDDVFAVQVRKGDSCIYRPIRRKLTDNDIKRHLRGGMTIATYPRKDSKSLWVCVDIDTRDKSGVVKVLTEMKKLGITPVLEDSGGKGYHLWGWFDRALPNWKARAIGQAVGCGNEIFPKQSTLEDGSYGSLVKTPLGVHRATGRFCGFVNENLQLVADQYWRLRNIKKHDGDALWQKVAAKIQARAQRISNGSSPQAKGDM